MSQNRIHQLPLFTFTLIVVGLVIGMGIFRTAATSAHEAIHPFIYFSAWILGGLIAVCGALTYAEIGSRFPVTGGYYHVFARVYHPSIAFGINCLILVSNAASLSGVALIGSGYLLRLFPGSYADWQQAAVSAVAIVVFYFINLKGLRLSGTVQNILMLIKIGMILTLIAAIFFPQFHVPSPSVHPGSLFSESAWIKSLGMSLIAVSFTYGGYQQTINFGHEVANPSRNIPRGIFIGLFIVITLYLLVNLSYYKVIGFDQMKQEKEIAFVVIQKLFGTAGATVFSGFLFLGVLAYVNGLLMTNPRVIYAMGKDQTLPNLFAKRNEKEVLPVALTVFTAICLLILFFSQEFEQILTFSIFLDCFGMILSSATIFRFRKQAQKEESKDTYRMKWYPLPTILFISAYLFVGLIIVWNDPLAAATGIGLLCFFTLLYFFRKRWSTTRSSL
jgi:APA family basic amino acid/polyamine antiporter